MDTNYEVVYSDEIGEVRLYKDGWYRVFVWAIRKGKKVLLAHTGQRELEKSISDLSEYDPIWNP